MANPDSASSLSHQPLLQRRPSQPQRGVVRLLGQKASIFVEFFDKLDSDEDGLLNAVELRSMFSYLFGDTVSNEHLQHFENRYLLQYGESGGLSKEKFLDILKDFDRVHGYNVDDDIREFYEHFVTDAEPKISPENLCKKICDLLPNELKNKLAYFKERLSRGVKIGPELNYENFHLVICALFKTYNFVQEQYQLVSTTVEPITTIANQFHRKKLQEKVALFTVNQTDRDKNKAAMHHLLDEVSNIITSKMRTE